MTSLSLPDMPPEMLWNIVGFLPDRSTKAQVSLTCKSLNDAVSSYSLHTEEEYLQELQVLANHVAKATLEKKELCIDVPSSDSSSVQLLDKFYECFKKRLSKLNISNVNDPEFQKEYQLAISDIEKLCRNRYSDALSKMSFINRAIEKLGNCWSLFNHETVDPIDCNIEEAQVALRRRIFFHAFQGLIAQYTNQPLDSITIDSYKQFVEQFNTEAKRGCLAVYPNGKPISEHFEAELRNAIVEKNKEALTSLVSQFQDQSSFRKKVDEMKEQLLKDKPELQFRDQNAITAMAEKEVKRIGNFYLELSGPVSVEGKKFNEVYSHAIRIRDIIDRKSVAFESLAPKKDRV